MWLQCSELIIVCLDVITVFKDGYRVFRCVYCAFIDGSSVFRCVYSVCTYGYRVFRDYVIECLDVFTVHL